MNGCWPLDPRAVNSKRRAPAGNLTKAPTNGAPNTGRESRGTTARPSCAGHAHVVRHAVLQINLQHQKSTTERKTSQRYVDGKGPEPSHKSRPCPLELLLNKCL